jgi:hypothetical protein
MLVVEKARRIRVEIRGPGSRAVLAILKRELPEIAVSDDDGYESIRGSAWFDSLLAEVTAGATLKVYRDNAGFTQARLSELTGIPVPHLSGMEHDRRPIGKAAARKLSAALGIDYRRLL